MDAVAAKICSVCGVDCSTMKRAKDAQGRYICGECLERAREAKVAKQGKPVVVPVEVAGRSVSKGPVAVGPDGRDMILDNLLKSSPAADAVACTECGFPMQPKALLCTHCGFNKEAGRSLRTVVVRAPKEKKESTSRRKASFHVGPWGAFGLIAGGSLGLLFGGMLLQSPGMILGAYVFWGICALWVRVALVFDGFRNSAVSGVIIILGMFFWLADLYTLVYVFTQAEETNQKAYLGVLFSFVVGLVAFLMALIPAPSFGGP